MLPIRGPFFMLVQGLYVFFSASTLRWNLLTDALKPLRCPTIKPLSDTRWEARYDDLHAPRKGYHAVLQVLTAMCDDNDQKKIKLKKQPGVLFHQWKSLKLVFYSRYGRA